MMIIEAARLEVPLSFVRTDAHAATAQVLMSREMKHQRCTARGPTQCPPMFDAGLLSPESIENLIGAWKGIEAEAAGVGAEFDVQPLSTRDVSDEEVLHAR